MGGLRKSGRFQEAVRGYPAAFLLFLGIYLLATVVLFPMTMPNVATILTFGPFLGNLYVLAGWLLSSTFGYGIGRMLGRDMLPRIAGLWLDRPIQQVRDHGFIAVLTIRSPPRSSLYSGQSVCRRVGNSFSRFLFGQRGRQNSRDLGSERRRRPS